MSSQLEIPSDPFHHGMSCGRTDQPFLELRTAKSFVACADHDHGAALLHRMLGIVQRFLGLIQIGVLRCSALGDQHDIRTLRDRLAIHFIQIGAACTVGRNHIAGNRIYNVLMFIQHRVHDKVDRAHSQRLFQILADRIALQFSGTGVGRNHEGMIALDSRRCGNTRHERFHAAGISGEIVKLNIAQRNAKICLSDISVKVKGCSV